MLAIQKRFVTIFTIVTKKYRSLAEYLDKTETTHDALAVRLGVTRAYVTMLAGGRRQPSLPMALRIERETGVPAASLVTAA